MTTLPRASCWLSAGLPERDMRTLRRQTKLKRISSSNAGEMFLNPKRRCKWREVYSIPCECGLGCIGETGTFLNLLRFEGKQNLLFSHLR